MKVQKHKCYFCFAVLVIIPSIVNSLRCNIGTQIGFPSAKIIKYWRLLITFPKKMETLRNKKKFAALNKENCEEHPRSNWAQNSNVPRSQEDYITQVSDEIEGRVTKKSSEEFSRTENRILGAVARLDDFLMNLLVQDHSGTAPETSRNALSTSKERMRTTPRMILILKQASSTTRWRKTLAKKKATTLAEFKISSRMLQRRVVSLMSKNNTNLNWKYKYDHGNANLSTFSYLKKLFQIEVLSGKLYMFLQVLA